MDMSYSKIRPRRGSVSELGLANPILALGEIIIEYPENGIGNGYCRIKIGDGERHYNDLSYALDGLQANSVIGGDAGNPSGFLSIRSDSTSKWELSDPVIGKDEIIYDQTKNGIKIGDGEHCFSELDYIWAQGNIKGVKGSAEPGYQTGYVIIDPKSIGLENVDNTHDKDKSVKYAESANKDADGNIIGDTYAKVTDLNALKTQIDNFISTSGHYVTDTQLTNIINQVNTRITNVSQMITNGNYLSKTEADQYYPSKTELNTLKNSVSNGKASVANAITAKGVSTATTAEFSTMASNIAKIQTGVPEGSQTIHWDEWQYYASCTWQTTGVNDTTTWLETTYTDYGITRQYTEFIILRTFPDPGGWMQRCKYRWKFSSADDAVVVRGRTPNPQFLVFVIEKMSNTANDYYKTPYIISKEDFCNAAKGVVYKSKKNNGISVRLCIDGTLWDNINVYCVSKPNSAGDHLNLGIEFIN